MATQARIDLGSFPAKPDGIGGANYEWWGYANGQKIGLIGDHFLIFREGTSWIDSQGWTVDRSGTTRARMERFLEILPDPPGQVVIYVFKDAGSHSGSDGSWVSKRAGWKFPGLFEVVKKDGFHIVLKMIARK